MLKVQQQELKQTYKSVIKASYFNTMSNNQFTKKSRIQIQKSSQDEKVDENTFRINRNFKLAQNYGVIQYSGKVYLESSNSLFSCFGRKDYHAKLFNSIFTISGGNKTKYYFDFNVIAASVKDNGKSFTLTINNDLKFQFFPVDNKSSVWTQTLQSSIKSSEGFKHPFVHILSINEYYKKPYISYKQFEAQANTGDIILFRSEHSAARVQQFITNSQYDHVAIVLRNKKNQLYLYESSSFDGVGLTQWSTMIRYQFYKQTQKIAWRKLNFELQPKHYNIIENFIVKTIGKQFQITFGKLFMQQSRLERKKQEQQQKTYFCSQLLARLYKQLGLLDPNVSCTQYYPVNFSNAGNIRLVNQKAKLQEQFVIAFD